ncbi:methylmalonyl-CoA mutase subunit beta [Mesorhizobium amorphae]|uniref:Methylmalonyl-CoA mutase n=1 Tax=Mesorhizobium amorphae CCNWGS0123 TaxID=1082933 RepID=G6YGB5_9HYPH|nr:methylmalonyl-CoA mutase subunit beta [Mesorhizobium amorphae]ANT50658.1 methylmalonyl-CoA mutase [Mesorhizobium amorphae CCNWGS0123]EHH09205.1 methylmalonyl-CoA mutase [Mesorhizobium amorphae CCNWGS0123]GLR42418.1 methylmalonyl-CoA mutase [Mesorhizobium amorphae]
MGAGALTMDVDLPNVERQRWLTLAEKALAGGSFEDKLVSHSDDGIRIEPLYERSVTAEPLVRANPKLAWIVSQRIDDPDIGRAKTQALEDVAQGATGLSLVFEGAPNAFGYGLPRTAEALETVLDGVPLNRVQIRIDAHPWSRAVADWLVAFLGKRRSDPAKLNLSFGIDPAAIFAGTGRLRMSIEALQASMPQSLAHFFSMGVPGVLLEADGRVFHNAGATEAQELGTMLASAVSYLKMFEQARQPLVYAAPHIGFALGVDQDQFLSMAKVRALRRLWARIQEACSIPASTASIHAETSYRMMTAADPETNILRTAIAGFAAAAGGADSISVLPHTIAHGLPAGFARRVARNTQLIMANESHVDHVADPASGSGAVEALTADLCAAAWEEFQRIEAEGGVLVSLQQGYIQNRVQTASAKRNAEYRSGERAIVGTTVFRSGTERPVETLPAERRPALTEGVAVCEPLFPVRIDQSIGAGS